MTQKLPKSLMRCDIVLPITIYNKINRLNKHLTISDNILELTKGYFKLKKKNETKLGGKMVVKNKFEDKVAIIEEYRNENNKKVGGAITIIADFTVLTVNLIIFGFAFNFHYFFEKSIYSFVFLAATFMVVIWTIRVIVDDSDKCKEQIKNAAKTA